MLSVCVCVCVCVCACFFFGGGGGGGRGFDHAALAPLYSSFLFILSSLSSSRSLPMSSGSGILHLA